MSDFESARPTPVRFDLKSVILAAVLGGIVGAVTTGLALRSATVERIVPGTNLHGEVGRLTKELDDLRQQHLDLKRDIESRRGIIPLASEAARTRR
jgi:hypothetical protein